MQKALFSICMHISAHRGRGRPGNVLQTDILIFPCSFLAQILTHGCKYYKFDLSKSATSSSCRIQMSPSYAATQWCYINIWMNKIFLFWAHCLDLCRCWAQWFPPDSRLRTGCLRTSSSKAPNIPFEEESILFPCLCSVQLFHFEKTAIFPLHYLGIFGEHQLFTYTWVYF